MPLRWFSGVARDATWQKATSQMVSDWYPSTHRSTILLGSNFRDNFMMTSAYLWVAHLHVAFLSNFQTLSNGYSSNIKSTTQSKYLMIFSLPEGTSVTAMKTYNLFSACAAGWEFLSPLIKRLAQPKFLNSSACNWTQSICKLNFHIKK